MIDRLKELEAATGRASLSPGTPSLPDEAAFFSKVDGIKDLLKQVEALIKRIEYLHRQALVAVSSEASQETDRTNQLVQQSKLLIKDLCFDANPRLATAQSTILSRRLLKILKDWEQLQRTYRAKYRAQLERQYLIMKPDAGRDELAALGECEIQLSQQMFTATHAEQRLREMRERQYEIRQIERSITELHQMFVDVSTMVNQQGEQIGRLEDYIASTAEYSGKAAEVIKKSVAQRRRSQRCKWIVIGVVLVLVAATIVIMYISHQMDQTTIVVHAPPPSPPVPQPPTTVPGKPPAPFQ